MRSKILIIFMCLSASLRAVDYNITDFGAIADGQSVNTKAVQTAIDKCSVTGGRVLIPRGEFVVGTLNLKDNVCLYLEEGAVLKGSKKISDYSYMTTSVRFFGEEWAHYALIYADHVKNVFIEGGGTIDGQGASFSLFGKKKPDKYKNRPFLLWFVGCENVHVRDVKLRNSGFWMQYYLCCKKVNIDGVDVFNHANKNNDMIDIDGCKDVTISHLTGDSDDDGITLKSTCHVINENITISDCIISSHCNALKFGTESVGGYRNVAISNIIIRPSSVKSVLSGSPDGISGVALEVADGGIMENVSINNVVIDSVQVPLFVRLCNRARKSIPEEPTPSIGKMRNIALSNITGRSTSSIGCSITGIPGGMPDGVFLSNCRFYCIGGEKGDFSNKSVPEQETLYPESTIFGTLPAYGLYVRHARNILLNGVSFILENEDNRPAVVLDDVTTIAESKVFTCGSKGGGNIKCNK